ncbi:MFS transporter [Inquilinus limosus]|uniref:MFS transporter n=1 Tax=Inquilinus limosus TaxID=171674 RepID=A0A211ZG83_9PROT|nr:MFS transporter [Inquilinus limosus]OWJ64281.1 MFS transporter [Inquilinus limosus]
MSVTSESLALASPEPVLTRPLILLFGTSVGVIVSNLFAPQTLVGLIGPSLGLSDAAAGLVAMATLLGYAAGLFLLVPLADLAENRRLILRMLAFAAACAGLAALAPTAATLLPVLVLLGAACSAIQILVPIAAAMAPPEQRGRVIGDVMGGLMVGILLSRPLASAIAGNVGWRGFYLASAVAMTVLTLVLAVRLPRRRPAGRTRYPTLIASLWHLLRQEPVLRARALTASLVMAAFSLFWTAVALRLAQSPFGLGQGGIALFALVGAGGAVVTPLAGRAGDRGWTRPATLASHLAVIAGFALAAWAGAAPSGGKLLPLVAMGLAAVVLDIGVTGDQTLGRRAVNLLRPEARGRLNGLFVGLFFLGGAVGSAAAGAAWAAGGWPLICLLGAGFGAAALVAGRFDPSR